MESLEFPNALAKQVLSQLSYTPTVGVTLILKHFRARRNPFLRFSVITVPKLTEAMTTTGSLENQKLVPPGKDLSLPRNP
jgi:hypothetical protein